MLEYQTIITERQTMSRVNIQQTVKPILPLVIVCCAAVVQAGTAGRVDLEALRQPIYTVDGDAFVRHNGERLNNRPLYCNQIPAIVVAGDRPLVRFGSGSMLGGTFIIALCAATRRSGCMSFRTSPQNIARAVWNGFSRTQRMARLVLRSKRRLRLKERAWYAGHA